MSKIKVAEVITRLDWGGPPDILRTLCANLNPQLYDITLFVGPTQHPSAKTKEFLRVFGQKVIVIPELKRNIRPISDFAAFLRLYFLFLRNKFDIVHTHTAKAGFLGRLAAFCARCPCIIHTPHGHNFYGYFGPIFSKMLIIAERIAACFTDAVTVFTELEKNDFIAFKIIKSEKLRLIYQGLELARYNQCNADKAKARKLFDIAADEKVVGLLARIEPIKGLDYFIEAARKVIDDVPGVKFIIVGEGSLRKQLEERIAALGLAQRFIFTGWREDIPEIISMLDILVLPSLNEAVGIVLIEAQAMGVPVVATQVGGIPEIVKDGQTGILVLPRDAQRLAKAMSELLTDEQKRLRMSETAANWMRGRFQPQDMVNNISALYQELSGR